MKYRTDFVTNSSSASIMIVIGRQTNKKLAAEMQKIFPDKIFTGADIKENYESIHRKYTFFGHLTQRFPAIDEFDDNKLYFLHWDYDWLTDGMRFGNSDEDEDDMESDDFSDKNYDLMTQEQAKRVDELLEKVKGFKFKRYVESGRD